MSADLALDDVLETLRAELDAHGLTGREREAASEVARCVVASVWIAYQSERARRVDLEATLRAERAA